MPSTALWAGDLKWSPYLTARPSLRHLILFPPPPILSSGPCGPQSPVVFREDQLDNVKAMYWLTSAETPTGSYGCSHGFT